MDIIYKYELEKENERNVKQGDIFYNVPVRSLDLIIESIPGNLNIIEDHSDPILKDVIANGRYILTESFIYPSWGILASQDCDIRPNYDLIFYPLIQTKSPKEKSQSIWNFLKDGVRKPTRKYYLPQLKPPNKPEFGPSYVLFQSPFIVSYNLIMNKEVYEKTWCARILEPARKVLLGKITNFYCRTPMDEFIFLSNSEISRFVEEKWYDLNGNKKTLAETIKKLTELRDALVYNDRRKDLQDILFINKHLVKQFKKFLTQFCFRSEENELIQICIDILSKEAKIANKKFFELIKKLYFEKGCLLEYINSSSFNKKSKIIQSLKEGTFLEDLLPPTINEKDIEEIRNIGFAAESSVKQLKKYKIQMLDYYKFFQLILFT